MLGYIALVSALAFGKKRPSKVIRLAPFDIEGRTGGGTILVDGGRLMSPYLARRGTRAWGDAIEHQGIDIGAPMDSSVMAASDGVILALMPDGVLGGYGNTIITANTDGSGNLYAHLNRFAPWVREGDKVYQGDIIGMVGDTQSPRPKGQMSPHLHFEVLSFPTTNIRLPKGPGETYHPPRLDPIAWLNYQGVSIG